MEKLDEYQGVLGKIHSVRDEVKSKFQVWKEEHPVSLSNPLRRGPPQPPSQGPPKEEDYSHIYRKKTRAELVRISAAVMGIEFSYAAETAFVSPTLLEIGVEHSKMTLVWALSPLVGFFLTPVLGSLSDKCHLPVGRRRPFISLLAFGVLIGLILVPNGRELGKKLGDYYPPQNASLPTTLPNGTVLPTSHPPQRNSHPWGVFFTVLGTVLLDFDADACQSPSRAYLLDVTTPEDHARGLSTFTIMAGLGGFMGYALGGINWDATFLGELLGGHVKAVFSLITVIFVLCVVLTVTSFTEIPLSVIESDTGDLQRSRAIVQEEREDQHLPEQKSSYGTVGSSSTPAQQETAFNKEVSSSIPEGEPNGHLSKRDDGPYEQVEMVEARSPSLKEYLLSIVYMPWSLRVLCLTNLFCWMSHVCYSLYFTDYVGEAVFGGDPQALEGSQGYELYEEGVRFGCWGMSMYSLSCSCYSMIIERLIQRFRARNVYVGGLLFYSCGMLLMALFNNKFGVIVFSWAAGVMYSTLFTMPYLLVAHYHSTNTFGGDEPMQTRGLGTDVALVSSMVFLAQFTLSLFMGNIISWSGTTTSVVCVASFLALCGSLTATQVLYLDL